MFHLNIQQSQSPKMLQLYGISRNLCTETDETLLRWMKGGEPLNLTKVTTSFKRYRKLLKDILPATISLNTRRSENQISSQGKEKSSLLTKNSYKNLEAQQSKQLMLANEHWKLRSEISGETFFENNCVSNSGNAAAMPRIHRPIGLLNINTSPQLIWARGFKTRHSDPDGRSFQKKTPDNTTAEFPSLNLGDGAGNNVRLWNEGYAAGKEAQMRESKSSSDKDSSAKTTVGPQGQKFWNFWNKFSIILSISVCLALLSQLTGFRIGFPRTGNEVMPEDIEVTFEDVKGCDEAKQELQEIVDFLMNPDKFSSLGGKLPKGCLLVGPPGTGKTLLARAVAGQAGVPFFQASGSEFDEVLVGQGARRVRDLFKNAKQKAPCVIFIDEIDSVGAKRTSSVLHPYANQTINQLLAEMDGFTPNEGVIVIGATNRSGELDRALLRPGRFDTEVTVPAPDMKGRKEILLLYLGKIKHDDSVDIDKLARMTVGFTGADLENMVNTSAIRAAVEGKDWVTMSEFEYSHDKHTLGTDWKSRVRDKEDLKITAYHEAGHTLVNYYTEHALPLHKVTIVSKGMSGGHTAFLPEKDMMHETKAQMLAQMDVSMGGRVGEEIAFGNDKITGGASGDLQGATNIAEYMVKKLGMSEKFGLRVVSESQQFGQQAELSQNTQEAMDSEINRLLNEAHKRASVLLKAHRKELDLLADALLKYETLDADDVKAIVEGNSKKVAQKLASNSVLNMNSVRKPQVNKRRTGPTNEDNSSTGDVLV